jgi:hypothetical protein
MLIVAFTFIGGFYFFLEYILPAEVDGFKFGLYHDQISRGIQVIGIMAVGLGIINILRVHGGRLLRSRSGWINSLALILGLFTMLIVEGLNLYQSEQRLKPRALLDNMVVYVTVVEKDWTDRKVDPEDRISALLAELRELKRQAHEKEGYLTTNPEDPESTKLHQDFTAAMEDCIRSAFLLAKRYHNSKIDQNSEGLSKASATVITTLKRAAIAASDLTFHNFENTNSKLVAHFFFYGFFVPLGAAMFSLLAFYIATAAYRSFRIRSLEALVMMVPAIVVMLGQIPHGPIYISEHLPEIRRWLLEYLNTPAFRAIFFGAATAGLAMAVRMWLSLETSPLSAQGSDGDES